MSEASSPKPEPGTSSPDTPVGSTNVVAELVRLLSARDETTRALQAENVKLASENRALREEVENLRHIQREFLEFRAAKHQDDMIAQHHQVPVAVNTSPSVLSNTRFNPIVAASSGGSQLSASPDASRNLFPTASIKYRREVSDAVAAAQERVRQHAHRGASPARSGTRSPARRNVLPPNGVVIAQDYLLQSGYFTLRDSPARILPTAQRMKQSPTDKLSTLSPKQQMDVLGVLLRKPTPGPATYSPLHNRLSPQRAPGVKPRQNE